MRRMLWWLSLKIRESEMAEVKSGKSYWNVLSGALIAHKHGFGMGNVQDKSTSATSRIQTEDPATGKKVHIVSPSSPVIGFSHFNEPEIPARSHCLHFDEQWKSINLIWHFLKRRPTVFFRWFGTFSPGLFVAELQL